MRRATTLVAALGFMFVALPPVAADENPCGNTCEIPPPCNVLELTLPSLQVQSYRAACATEPQPIVIHQLPEETTIRVESSDCVPEASMGIWGSIQITCAGDRPCGVNQEPICWTYRLACMNAIVLVLRVWDNQEPHRNSHCEGQPGWP